jgi:peptidoglycan/LPS O-acetylase OafA/YrhL
LDLTSTRSAPGTVGWSHRPHLDGLRTVAIYLVVLFHAGFQRFAGGFIGVDVFFVLSGFLVGSVIVHEYESTGRISLIRFYARRVRRLLPAAVVMVVGVSAMSLVVEPRLAREGFIDDAQSALLYFANWHFLSDATNYFANDVDKSPFLHFWSLAIEEQFYVVFPLLLLGLFVLAKRLDRPSIIPTGLALAMVASVTAQLVVASNDPLRAYYGTDTRFYQLLAGTTLAVLAHQVRGTRRPSGIRPKQQRTASCGALLAVLAVVFVATSWFDVSTAWRGVTATVCTVAVIVALELAPTGLLGRVLASNPMTYLGRISYGTYLWHWPLIVLAVPILDLGAWQRAALSGIGGTALAALSFQLIESPIRTSKIVLRRPGAMVACGLTISLIAAVAIVPPILHDDSRPALAQRADSTVVTVPELDSAQLAAELQRALATPAPAELDLDPTQMTPVDQSNCTADDPGGCILHRGHTFHMLLLGDSNAEMLIPAFVALAQQHGFTLSVSTRLGCPWQQGLLWKAKDQRLIDSCLAGRTTWYDDLLPKLAPDLVVVFDVPRDPGSRPDAFWVPADGELGSRSLDDVIASSTTASLDQITGSGARVVILEPMPYPNFDPVICMSGAATVADCSFQNPAAPYPTETIYRSEDVARADVASVDIDKVACPFLPACVPLIDGELVYRNEFHLSEQWIMDHTDQLWSLIAASGLVPG